MSAFHSVSAGWKIEIDLSAFSQRKRSFKCPGSVWVRERVCVRLIDWRRNLPNGCGFFFLSLVICYAVQSVTLMRQGEPCCHCLIDFWRRPCSQEHSENSLLNLHMVNVVGKQVRDAHRGRGRGSKNKETHGEQQRASTKWNEHGWKKWKGAPETEVKQRGGRKGKNRLNVWPRVWAGQGCQLLAVSSAGCWLSSPLAFKREGKGSRPDHTACCWEPWLCLCLWYADGLHLERRGKLTKDYWGKPQISSPFAHIPRGRGAEGRKKMVQERLEHALWLPTGPPRTVKMWETIKK